MIPYYYFLITYRAKTLLAIESMKSLPVLLFSDQGAMRTLGRGAGKRQEDIKPASPFTHRCLADFMSQFASSHVFQFSQ
jgi:hypothetical protein